MEAESIGFLEEKFKQIVKMAAYQQAVATIIAASILYFKPPGYKEIGQSFSVLALFASFAVSRWYIYTGKKIEVMKTFSDEDGADIKNELYIPRVSKIGNLKRRPSKFFVRNERPLPKRQGASENKNFEAESTQSKTNFWNMKGIRLGFLLPTCFG